MVGENYIRKVAVTGLAAGVFAAGTLGDITNSLATDYSQIKPFSATNDFRVNIPNKRYEELARFLHKEGGNSMIMYSSGTVDVYHYHEQKFIGTFKEYRFNFELIADTDCNGVIDFAVHNSSGDKIPLTKKSVTKFVFGDTYERNQLTLPVYWRSETSVIEVTQGWGGIDGRPKWEIPEDSSYYSDDMTFSSYRKSRQELFQHENPTVQLKSIAKDFLSADAPIKVGFLRIENCSSS